MTYKDQKIEFEIEKDKKNDGYSFQTVWAL